MWVRFCLGLGLLVAYCAIKAPIVQADQDADFFEQRIRPLLVEHCHKCHTEEKKRGNLLLVSRAALLKGGDSGPAIVPGDPEKSLLIKAIRYVDDELRMPPKSKLSEEQIADLTRWIANGAVWPASNEAKAAGKVDKGFDLWERAKHWSFQPITRPVVPNVAGATSIDAFLQAKRQGHGISATGPADKRTLIRRVTFDLIGLPPTSQQIDAFLKDDSPDAFAKVVDQLLASPHYGERWGRHWLDLVRYAETCGHEHDLEIADAYHYRDYVIRALNADLPFDQFAIEHVAGDLLKNPRKHPVTGTNQSILGTGFWYLGEGKHSPVDVRGDEADRLDNQIDVFGKTFLGLTIACARCHDHKFDAISTRDYYALAGYLESSRRQRAFLNEVPAPTVRELKSLRTELDKFAAKEPNPSKMGLPAGSNIFADFSQSFDGWSVTGQAFGAGPTLGSAAYSTGASDKSALVIVPPGVAHSGLLSPKLQGVLRSKTFTISQGKIAYRAAGRKAQINLIIDGFQLISSPIYGGLTLKVEHGEKFAWLVQDVSMWLGHKAYIELIDDGPGYLAVDCIVFCNQSPSSATQELAPILVSDEERSLVASLRAKRERLEAQMPMPERGVAMADGTAWNERVYIRGNHKNLGEPVPRRFLEALGGKTPASAGSGRLELAHELVSSSNPLLPRVIVNRIWHHHFGEGLVRSVDNFGMLGELPTHPELLDYLADDFVRNGWSLKRLHRSLLLSQAYQMSSEPMAESAAKDPLNKLLHCMPVRRLEAECIRDAMLAVSGELREQMYGPGVPTHLTPHMAGRGRPGQSGPLDGNGRKSVYLSIRRNFLSPLFLAFDFPIPFTTIGKRMASNVPAQALAMLNNPLVLQQAERWARHALELPGRAVKERIIDLYGEAFGRQPTAKELADAVAFVEDAASRETASELRVWTDLCHVLMNVKEFIYIR